MGLREVGDIRAAVMRILCGAGTFYFIYSLFDNFQTFLRNELQTGYRATNQMFLRNKCIICIKNVPLEHLVGRKKMYNMILRSVGTFDFYLFII
ncbi:hypothetical protein C4F50_01950 [Flavobacterium sp. KB82]|uniref:RDD family protein n=1 Tax=Flavobacterium hungaricum TaxID=2082725 RepID=A0ABR9TEB4_9FLAO|nr:hypothetical protein [Flavobacterium hungaricum]